MTCDHDWVEVDRSVTGERQRVVYLGTVLGGTKKHIERTFEITYRCQKCGAEITRELITHIEEPCSVSD